MHIYEYVFQISFQLVKQFGSIPRSGRDPYPATV